MAPRYGSRSHIGGMVTWIVFNELPWNSPKVSDVVKPPATNCEGYVEVMATTLPDLGAGRSTSFPDWFSILSFPNIKFHTSSTGGGVSGFTSLTFLNASVRFLMNCPTSTPPTTGAPKTTALLLSPKLDGVEIFFPLLRRNQEQAIASPAPCIDAAPQSVPVEVRAERPSKISSRQTIFHGAGKAEKS